jgi:hypothetical protein
VIRGSEQRNKGRSSLRSCIEADTSSEGDKYKIWLMDPSHSLIIVSWRNDIQASEFCRAIRIIAQFDIRLPVYRNRIASNSTLRNYAL